MYENRIQALQPADSNITICPQMTVPPMNYAARSLRLRIPRICVSITGREAAELLDKAEAVLRENTLIELRLDHLKAPLTAMPKLRRLMELRPDAILIATCRRTVSGGTSRRPLAAELEVLRKAADAGCPAFDIAIESAEAMSGRRLGRPAFASGHCAFQPRFQVHRPAGRDFCADARLYRRFLQSCRHGYLPAR